MSLTDRQQELAGYLIAGFPEYGLKGWSIKGACASAGNGTQENLCGPVTSGQFDHGSDGIYQWRLARLTELKSWTAGNGLDWTTIKAQAAFHMYEMRRDYQALNQWLIEGKKSLETLTADVCDIYERPSADGRVLDKRIAYARDVYALMQNKAPTSVPSVVTGTAGIAIAGIGGLIHYLQSDPHGPVLSLVIAGTILMVVSLFLSKKKPEAESTATFPSVPAVPAVPLQPLEKLKTLLEERAQIDSQILDLEIQVKASISSMNDLLGQIHPVVMTTPSQQVAKQGA